MCPCSFPKASHEKVKLSIPLPRKEGLKVVKLHFKKRFIAFQTRAGK